MTDATEPAFPIVETREFVSMSAGLTKREYFAAMAMQGLISSMGHHDLTNFEDMAHDAVLAANNLIEELNKQS